MPESCDVAIIGAGSAGLAALREVRRRTERFVLINDGPYGTTCARVGCMPSKALIEAANAFHRRHAFDAFGIRGARSLAADIPAVLRRVRELRDDFVAGTLSAIAGLGPRSIAGRARLLGPDRVQVDGREIQAARIIVATGSRPAVPEAWRRFGQRLLTTDTLFEQQDLPPRLAVIGMGAIGVELAQALARLGIQVQAFGSRPTLAGLSDPMMNAACAALLREEFPLHLGVPAELAACGDGIRVTSGDTATVVDGVLAALGRRPNIDGLGLENLGVPLDAAGMPPVDPGTLRIADLPVFFAGDANGRVPLLHESADEGYIAGTNAVRDEVLCFRRRTSLVIVFSDPNIALVGQRFVDLDSSARLLGEAGFTRQGRARLAQRNQGGLRIYAEPGSGRLLGTEMCAPDGEHLAHLLALAIDQGLTVSDVLAMPFYHPVLEEGLRRALRDLAAQLPAGKASDLAACAPYDVDALD